MNPRRNQSNRIGGMSNVRKRSEKSSLVWINSEDRMILAISGVMLPWGTNLKNFANKVLMNIENEWTENSWMWGIHQICSRGNWKNNIAKSKMNSNMAPKTFVLHFSELYNAAHIVNDEFKLFIQMSIDTHDISCKSCRDTDLLDTDDLLFLNNAFSEKEIHDAIMSMSNNKSPGLDGIVIELIKAAISFYIPMLEKLFNKILDSGIYPEDCCKAILCPIHKKGSVTDPINYRGISLLPVISKVFTKILSQRLNEWADHTMRQEEQAGFRKGYSTADQIFNLQCIVQKYIAREKGQSHILFVYFATAFNRIPHSHLFFKLIKAGRHGKTLKILRSVYGELKTCMRTPDGLTEFFTCLLGTRQGFMLSPLLFALYIEELLQMFKSAGCRGIYIDEIADNVMALLFADDVAMCSETVGRLREMIRVLEDFSKKWQLKIHLEKTKILVFRIGGKIKNNEVFYYENKRIEIVNSYKYLGIFFYTLSEMEFSYRNINPASNQSVIGDKHIWSKMWHLDIRCSCRNIW